MASSPLPIRESIVLRMLKLSFLFYLMITTVVTALHFCIEYTNTRRSIAKELLAYREMFEPVLKQGLWRLDSKQWRLTVDGMLLSPILEGVRILNEYGEVIYANGIVRNEAGEYVLIDRAGRESPARQKNYLFERIFEHHFTIFHKGYRLGEASLYYSDSVVFNRLKISFLFIILNTLVKTAAIWIFFIWIGKRILSRPLSELVETMDQIDLDNISHRRIRTRTEGRNELWLLKNTFNAMLDKLNQSIRDREWAEAEKNRLFAAIEQAAEEVIITDHTGRIQYANPTLVENTGYTKAEMLGHHVRFLRLVPSDVGRTSEMDAAFSERTHFTGRITQVRKDGSLYEVSTRVSPVQDKSGKIGHFVLVQSDISHELELERRLLQAQKMEAIGTLAGGIAHDFNNILFPIMMYAEMTYNDQPRDSIARSNLEAILQAANRAKELVKQILTFSRRQAGSDFQPISIQPLVKESIKLLRASLPSTIDFRQTITEETACVMGDPTQLQQMIVNLCTNAYHAMRETGGVLDISLEAERLDADLSKGASVIPAGSYLRFRVRDSGHGIPPEVRERMFEPYFTTKPVGEGTGLGLSIVHGVVKKHGGHISVESEEGKGTTFDIYLPTAAKNAQSIQNSVIMQGEMPKGSEHLLVVDDEAPVLQVETAMLKVLGYRVTPFLNSMDAYHAFAKSPESFDLVITDMTMPVMTGDQLAEKILSIRPNIPILLCSGFTERLKREALRSIGIRDFLVKPLGSGEMAQTVRQVLDTQGDSDIDVAEKN